MAIVVKCPICNRIKTLQQIPRYFFKCCGIAHDISQNTVNLGYKRVEEKTEKTRVFVDSDGRSALVPAESELKNEQKLIVKEREVNAGQDNSGLESKGSAETHGEANPDRSDAIPERTDNQGQAKRLRIGEHDVETD